MSFAPVYGPGSRALILGSWPSPKSWDMGFYYGHPHNRFWPLLARLTGEALPAREDVAAKRKMILDHGLALWDVLASCTIEGASDASIRDAVPEDIGFLLARGAGGGGVLQRGGGLQAVRPLYAAGQRHRGGAPAQHQPGQRRLEPGPPAGGLGRSPGPYLGKKEVK